MRCRYRELNPIDYLQRTHDGQVYDIAFDGENLMLASEAWICTDPIEPIAGQCFEAVFSRYLATFKGVGNLSIVLSDPRSETSDATLASFVREQIRDFAIALPSVTIGMDEHEIHFTCISFEVTALSTRP